MPDTRLVPRLVRPIFLMLLGMVVLRCGIVKEFTQPSTLAIQKFVATPADINSGAAATLTWEVDGADSIEIDNGIGTVTPKGTRQVTPAWTTSFNLVARAGSSQATATVQVRVVPGPSPSPSASPSPSPSPSASPSPSPSPSSSPSPSPSPSPTPTPVPSPTPTPVTCSAPATAAGNCSLTIVKPTTLVSGECIEVNAVNVNQSCPVGFNTSRSLSFDVTAHTSRTGLRWRRSVTSSDVLSPSEGAIAHNGTTSVLLTDLVLDSAVTIEIVDGTNVLVAFTLRHY
jgi:hypothetical protein